jgi:hypothetical protein
MCEVVSLKAVGRPVLNCLFITSPDDSMLSFACVIQFMSRVSLSPRTFPYFSQYAHIIMCNLLYLFVVLLCVAVLHCYFLHCSGCTELERNESLLYLAPHYPIARLNASGLLSHPGYYYHMIIIAKVQIYNGVYSETLCSGVVFSVCILQSSACNE